MVKLQLALDFKNLDDALSVAEKAADHVDIMEAGTPLIKSEGLKAVTTLKKHFPDKMVVADMKTMDTGFFEAELAYNAGADMVSVLGAADRETIKGVSDAALKYGKKMLVDTIGVESMEKLAEKIKGISVDYIAVHCGIDQQNAGSSPFETLDTIAKLGLDVKIAVAGGLNVDSVQKLQGYPKVGIAMVGGAITKAENPESAAREIKVILNGIR